MLALFLHVIMNVYNYDKCFQYIIFEIFLNDLRKAFMPLYSLCLVT